MNIIDYMNLQNLHFGCLLTDIVPRSCLNSHYLELVSSFHLIKFQFMGIGKISFYINQTNTWHSAVKTCIPFYCYGVIQVWKINSSLSSLASYCWISVFCWFLNQYSLWSCNVCSLQVGLPGDVLCNRVQATPKGTLFH